MTCTLKNAEVMKDQKEENNHSGSKEPKQTQQLHAIHDPRLDLDQKKEFYIGKFYIVLQFYIVRKIGYTEYELQIT